MKTTRRIAPLALAITVLVAAAGMTACTPKTKGVVASEAAVGQIGMPYKTGGTSPAAGGFDCSGLVIHSWKQAGVSITARSAAAQYTWSTRIKESQLRPGDLVFYKSASTVSHVALYVGNGDIVQARKPGVNLSRDKVATFWRSQLVGFGRVPGT